LPLHIFAVTFYLNSMVVFLCWGSGTQPKSGWHGQDGMYASDRTDHSPISLIDLHCI